MRPPSRYEILMAQTQMAVVEPSLRVDGRWGTKSAEAYRRLTPAMKDLVDTTLPSGVTGFADLRTGAAVKSAATTRKVSAPRKGVTTPAPVRSETPDVPFAWWTTSTALNKGEEANLAARRGKGATLDGKVSRAPRGETKPPQNKSVRVEQYTQQVQPAVLTLAKKLGFAKPAFILAQMDHESGNGKSLSAPFNYSGLKTPSGKESLARAAKWGATAGAPVVTGERYGGKDVKIKASFLSFPSAEAYAGYYLETLAKNFPETLSATTAFDFATGLIRGRFGSYFTGDQSKYAANIEDITRKRYNSVA